MRTHAFVVLRDRLRRRLRRLTRGGDAAEAFRLPRGAGGAGARDGLALVAVVKDEAPYLEEWICFHAALGARAVILYDNGSTDGTPALLAAGGWGVELRRIDWQSFDGLNATQGFAHSHAIANYGRDFRWMAFIDVDEFLFPLEDPDLPTALARFADQPAISLPWFNFGPDGHATRPSGPVTASYGERAVFPPRPDQSALLRFKSIVDPAAVTHGGTHRFGLEGYGRVLINEAGEAVDAAEARRPGFARSEVLRLNHYFTRSKAELAAKLAKGRVSANGAMNPAAYDRRLAQYAKATTHDDAIGRHLPALHAAIAARRAQGLPSGREATPREAAG